MGLLFNRTNSGFLYPINKTVDSVIAASNGLACLASSIFGAAINPADILKGLALIGASLVNSIISAVADVVLKHVKGMLGALLAPVKRIEGIITDLTKILISVQNILDKASNMDNYFKKRQECANQGAQLLNCIAQSAINQITRKVAMNVDKELGKISSNVAKNAFKADGAILGHIDKHTKFIAKAQLQTKLLL